MKTTAGNGVIYEDTVVQSQPSNPVRCLHTANIESNRNKIYKHDNNCLSIVAGKHIQDNNVVYSSICSCWLNYSYFGFNWNFIVISRKFFYEQSVAN